MFYLIDTIYILYDPLPYLAIPAFSIISHPGLEWPLEGFLRLLTVDFHLGEERVSLAQDQLLGHVDYLTKPVTYSPQRDLVFPR